MQGRHLLRLSHDIQLYQGTIYYTPPRDCLQYWCTPICIFLNLCVYTYIYPSSYTPSNARPLYYTPPRDCLQYRCTPICIFLNLCVYTYIYPSSYAPSNARTLYYTPPRDCLQYWCTPICILLHTTQRLSSIPVHTYMHIPEYVSVHMC